MAFAKANPIKIMLNGTELVTAKAAQKVDGVIMLPLKEFGALFGKEVKYDEKTNTVSVDPVAGVMVGESEDKSVRITGNKTESGTFDHLQITTPVFSRSIPGYNVTNPSYAPQISNEDIDGDGIPDIVVILTTGYGTGVYQSNVLVYNSDGSQVPVEDANTAFLKQFSGSYSGEGMDIQVQDKRYKVPFTSLFSDKNILGGKPGIGGIMRYSIENGVLTATTAVQVSMAEFVGDLKLKYTFKNGLLQAGDASFELYPEYQS